MAEAAYRALAAGERVLADDAEPSAYSERAQLCLLAAQEGHAGLLELTKDAVSAELVKRVLGEPETVDRLLRCRPLPADARAPMSYNRHPHISLWRICVAFNCPATLPVLVRHGLAFPAHALAEVSALETPRFLTALLQADVLPADTWAALLDEPSLPDESAAAIIRAGHRPAVGVREWARQVTSRRGLRHERGSSRAQRRTEAVRAMVEAEARCRDPDSWFVEAITAEHTVWHKPMLRAAIEAGAPPTPLAVIMVNGPADALAESLQRLRPGAPLRFTPQEVSVAARTGALRTLQQVTSAGHVSAVAQALFSDPHEGMEVPRLLRHGIRMGVDAVSLRIDNEMPPVRDMTAADVDAAGAGTRLLPWTAALGAPPQWAAVLEHVRQRQLFFLFAAADAGIRGLPHQARRVLRSMLVGPGAPGKP